MSGTTTAAVAAPPAPTKLAVSSVTASSLALTWTSGGGTTAGYRIAIAAGSTAPACSTGTAIGKVTSYTESSLGGGTKYTVSLCAVNSAGALSTAATVSGTTSGTVPVAPPAPTSFVVSSYSSASLSLTWKSGGGTTTGYKLAIAAGTSAPSCSSGVVLGNVTAYTESGLAAGTQYTHCRCVQ